MVLPKRHYSMYIVHYELCSIMKAQDVLSTVENAKKAGLKKEQRSVLFSNNGSCCVLSELKYYLASEFILPIH